MSKKVRLGLRVLTAIPGIYCGTCLAGDVDKSMHGFAFGMKDFLF